MMNSWSHIPTEEILNIANDPVKRKSYNNPELHGFILNNLSNVSGIFHEQLPYEEIRNYVENIGKDIFSKFDEEERNTLRWEHVGSTSIPGMPGTNIPDACLIYEQFPPSEKIIKSLQESSFYFFRTFSHMSDEDLWFGRIISEEGFLKGSLMTIHLVDQNNVSSKLLLDIRDTCRNEKMAFDEYKECKSNAFKACDGLRDYNMKKSSSTFIEIYRKKYGLQK